MWVEIFPFLFLCVCFVCCIYKTVLFDLFFLEILKPRAETQAHRRQEIGGQPMFLPLPTGHAFGEPTQEHGEVEKLKPGIAECVERGGGISHRI